MLSKQFIQDYFNADFKSIDSLLNDVLVPIFGDFDPGFTEITIATDKAKEMARAAHIKTIQHVATFEGLGLEIKVFDVTLDDNSQIHKARKNIQALVRQFVERFEGAFIVFHYEDPTNRSWRLSYLEKRESNTASTNAKRYTYLCGKQYPCRTLAERFEKLQTQDLTAINLETAFSVEALSNEFFDEYRYFYQDLVNYVMYENNNLDGFIDYADGDKELAEKYARDYIKKLMGRLVFIQFLQNKAWLNNDIHYTHTLFDECSEEQKYNFLDKVLEPLFFGVFNTPKEAREALFRKEKWDMNLYQEWKDFPYLNGGLFECDELDKLELPLPAYFFSNPERKDHVRTPNDQYYEDACGIFDFFDRYNFTIDESDQLDREIGVDPEMLGKIFENLLEDNKDKGAFYTPKEIVDYMCKEALIAYLVDEARRKSEVNKQRQDNFEDAIRAFVNDPEMTVIRMQKYGDQQLIDLNESLCSVKICDPAIGSGAFPMGLLNLLINCRVALNDALHKGEPRAWLKKEIIQNNIYGVDIEQGAIDIARLRFWLSIVVDLDDPEALPNFDYKFMQGNSLLEQYEGVDLSIITQNKSKDHEALQITMFEDQLDVLRHQLQDHLHEYFATTDHRKKEVLRNDIRENVNQQLREQHIRVSFPSQYDISANTDFFLWHTWFDEVFNRQGKQGFDIVIGNPPYISAPTQMANEILAAQRQRIVDSKYYNSLYQKWDIYIPFMELGIRHLCAEGGVMTMIVPYPLSNQMYAEKLRKMFTHDYNLYQVVDLKGTKIFDNATVSNCIPFVSKTKQQENITIANINEQRQIFVAFEQPLDKLRIDEKSEVWNLTQEQRQANRHPNMHILSDFCYVSKGMVLNADEKSAKGEFKKEDLISETKDAIHCRRYIEAKDIERFRIKRVRYLEYDTPRVPDQLSRPTFRELYERNKLLVNSIGNIQATIDVGLNCLHNHSISCAVRWCDLKGVTNKSILGVVKKFSNFKRPDMEHMSEQYDIRFFLGIVNSHYAQVLLNDIRGGGLSIYPEHVRKLPIPDATPAQQQPIIDLVDAILAAKAANPQADTASLEAQIDSLVYQLYNLTPDEIALIEQ